MLWGWGWGGGYEGEFWWLLSGLRWYHKAEQRLHQLPPLHCRVFCLNVGTLRWGGVGKIAVLAGWRWWAFKGSVGGCASWVTLVS